MVDFYYGPDAAAAMPLVQGASTVPGKLDLATMLGSLFPALRDRGGSADYAPDAFRPAEGAPVAPAAAAPVLPNDPKVAGMVTGSGVPYPTAGIGGGPFGLDAGEPVTTTADHVPGGVNAPPSSPPPPLDTKPVPPTPTDNPKGPPSRPEQTTVKGAPPASLFQRLGMGDWNTSRLLLSMAAGFGGAPNIGAGIGRAAGNVAGAIPGIQQSQMQVAGVNLTARYLQSKGLSADDALAAAINPEIAKGVLPLVQGTGNTVDNGIVLDATKRPIADIRPLLGGAWETKKVTDRSGREYDVQVNKYTGQTRYLNNPAEGGNANPQQNPNTVQGQRHALPPPGGTWTAPDGTVWRRTGASGSDQNAWQRVQ